jgi:hypothetical protein
MIGGTRERGGRRRRRPAWLPGALERLEALGADPRATASARRLLEGYSPGGRTPRLSATPGHGGIGVTFRCRDTGKAETIITPDGFRWYIYPGDP